MEVKKIVCPGCGANIDFSKSDKKEVKCEYCHSIVYLDDNGEVKEDKPQDEAINVEGGNTAFKIFFSIIFALVFFIIFLLLILQIANIKPSADENKNKYSESDISSFNSDLEMFSGTESGFMLSHLLDEVVTKNKTESNHLITVSYKDKETNKPDEIISIKHSLQQSKQYEVSLDYDSDGFVNKVTISDL